MDIENTRMVYEAYGPGRLIGELVRDRFATIESQSRINLCFYAGDVCTLALRIEQGLSPLKNRSGTGM